MGQKYIARHDDVLFKERIDNSEGGLLAFQPLPANREVRFDPVDYTPTDDSNAEIRFVSIGGQTRTPLSRFVASTFGQVTIHSVTSDDIRGFSAALGSYSVLVVLVDDVMRAKRVLREVKPMIASKLCYAIMTESTPPTRAALIRAIFDDVFDVRSKPQEILMRIRAHRARQAQFDERMVEEEEFEAFCERNLEGPVHSLQVPVLRRLFESMGHVVKYRDLAAYDFQSGEFRTDSLTVRIHNLRRKLKNYDIRCTRGAGYALVKASV